MADHRVGDDDQEPVVGELRDGQVGLEPAVAVQPLRVRDLAPSAVDVVRRDPVQAPARVASLHEKLAHERHAMTETHSRCAMLGLPLRPPVRATPRERPRICDPARTRVPARRFPAARFDEIRALRRESIVKRRAARAAGGLVRLERVVTLVDATQRFDRARATVFGVGLVRQHTIDVHRRDVDVRQAVDDPVGDDAPDAAARQDADRS